MKFPCGEEQKGFNMVALRFFGKAKRVISRLEKGTPAAQLRELWSTFDEDGSGTLEREEVADVIAAAFERTPSHEELDMAMAEMDEDGSGEVDFEEFSVWWNKQRGVLRERARRNMLSGTSDDTLQKLWAEFDEDGSGTLERDEVAGLMAAAFDATPEEAELEAAFADMDADGSGEIDFGEFSVWWGKQGSVLRDRARRRVLQGTPTHTLQKLWADFDEDGSGTLERAEVAGVMAAAFGEVPEPAELDQAFADMDEDGSGEIDFEEFSQWWNKQQSVVRQRAMLRMLESTQQKTEEVAVKTKATLAKASSEPPRARPRFVTADMHSALLGRTNSEKVPPQKGTDRVAVKLQIDICKAALLEAAASGDSHSLQAALAQARDLGGRTVRRNSVRADGMWI
jgi:calmodulin